MNVVYIVYVTTYTTFIPQSLKRTPLANGGWANGIAGVA